MIKAYFIGGPLDGMQKYLETPQRFYKAIEPIRRRLNLAKREKNPLPIIAKIVTYERIVRTKYNENTHVYEFLEN